MKKIIRALIVWGASVALLVGVSYAFPADLPNLLNWCTTNSGAINVSYQECNGLAYLFTETSGVYWNHTNNWFFATDLTTWVHPGDVTTGALTIAGGHIVGMTLNAWNLSGSITTGLMYLPYLTTLDLRSNNINYVNLSQNTWLINLDIFNNTMSGVNLTMLTGLKVLSVWSTDMNSINLSQNINLRQVWIYGVNSSWVDFSANTLLTGLRVANMPLTGLDFRNNTQLISIEASYNSGRMIQTINVSGLTLLKTLNATHAWVRYMDLSTNTALEGLGLDGSFLTGLNLSGLSNLKSIGIAYNQLTQLDVSRNPLLQYLYIGSQSGVLFTGIDISHNTWLLSLGLENNPISWLTIAANAAYPSTGIVYLSGNVLNPNALDLNTLWFLHDHYADWGYRGIAGGTPIVIPTDNCPNGDTSPTFYDGMCSSTSGWGGGGWGSSSSSNTTVAATGSKATSGSTVTWTTATDIQNSVPTTITSTTMSETDIYNWAFANHITTLPLTKARLHDGILRYEAAKMIVNFAENVMHSRIEHNPLCNVENYGDKASFDPEMKEMLTKICDLWLMGWSVRNEKLLWAFRPFDTLSADEFGIVIGRYLGEESSKPKSSMRIDIMKFLNSVTN